MPHIYFNIFGQLYNGNDNYDIKEKLLIVVNPTDKQVNIPKSISQFMYRSINEHIDIIVNSKSINTSSNKIEFTPYNHNYNIVFRLENYDKSFRYDTYINDVSGFDVDHVFTGSIGKYIIIKTNIFMIVHLLLNISTVIDNLSEMTIHDIVHNFHISNFASMNKLDDNDYYSMIKFVKKYIISNIGYNSMNFARTHTSYEISKVMLDRCTRQIHEIRQTLNNSYPEYINKVELIPNGIRIETNHIFQESLFSGMPDYDPFTEFYNGKIFLDIFATEPLSAFVYSENTHYSRLINYDEIEHLFESNSNEFDIDTLSLRNLMELSLEGPCECPCDDYENFEDGVDGYYYPCDNCDNIGISRSNFSEYMDYTINPHYGSRSGAYTPIYIMCLGGYGSHIENTQYDILQYSLNIIAALMDNPTVHDSYGIRCIVNHYNTYNIQGFDKYKTDKDSENEE